MENAVDAQILIIKPVLEAINTQSMEEALQQEVSQPQQVQNR